MSSVLVIIINSKHKLALGDGIKIPGGTISTHEFSHDHYLGLGIGVRHLAAK